MRWFEGNIAEAVTKSKAINAIFIVFVEGTDDISSDLSQALDTPAVSTRLEDREKFLSIKLSSTSENYTHFAQIYKLVPVPSVFFIGRDGAPLEVVCGGITADKLSERIDKIVKEYYKNPTLTIQDSSPSTSSTSLSKEFLQAESQAQQKQAQPIPIQSQPEQAMPPSQPQPELEKTKYSQTTSDVQKTQCEKDKVENAESISSDGPTAAKQSKADEEYEIVCDGDVCVRQPKATTSAGVSTEQMVTEAPPVEQPSLDTRLERAKELLEAKRLEKEAKEKELEKQKELERRALGHGVVELKRWQQEQELKEAAEERRRERLANELARQRVLEQIAQDRAERRAKLSPPPDTASASVSPSAPVATGQVRIQFKMADGETRVASFNPDSTLADVHAYIRESGLVQSNRFSLWTMFPRQELPASADSLVSQGLAPSAALLVLLGSGGTSAAPAVPSPVARIYAFVTTLLTTVVLEPLSGAWSWLSTRLFPSRAHAPASPPRPASNVHQLRGDRSSDDENNTWNGNSTQQM